MPKYLKTSLAFVFVIALTLQGCGDDTLKTDDDDIGEPKTECGNNLIENNEECDGTDMGTAQCSDFGDFISGTMRCNSDCTYNTRACELPPLTYDGTYEMLSIYDLSAAMPDGMTDIYNIVSDPDGYIINVLTGQIYGFVCPNPNSGICDILVNDLGMDLENYIRSQIEDTVTDYIDDQTLSFDRIAAGIDSTSDFMKQVEVLSTVIITPDASTDTNFSAFEEWNNITFVWDFECPEDDLECGRYTFAVDTLNMNESVLEDTYTGDVAEPIMHLGTGSDLRIFYIEYGLLIEVFYEQVLIPHLTNDEADSMSDLAAWLVDCPSIANSIDASDGASDGQYSMTVASFTLPGIPVANLISMCVDAATSIGAQLEARLEKMITLGGSEMITEGQCTMGDHDSNYQVELLEQGIWSGTLERQETDGGTDIIAFPVTGTFNAILQ